MAGQRVKRLLIYRMGSLGDTVVALPAFHMLARRFADAERRVLTNFPVSSDAAPIQAVLGVSGLAHGYFPYPIGTRSPARLLALSRDIAAWAPDLAVYLTPRNGPALWRDLMFLRLCGIRRIVGAPTQLDQRRYCKDGPHGLYESEASRLARCMADIGAIDLGDPAGWSLALTPAERDAATRAIDDWPGAGRFVAFSIGAKIAIKEWGDVRWAALLAALSARHPALGLAMVGGPNDGARSQAVARGWNGPTIDLCGRLTPRESACVIERAELFMGHDSGPMHLAASVGTTAVSVFSTHREPGIWFPHGARHRIFYPGLSWSGGDPPVFRDAAGERTIAQIPVAPVLEACETLLGDDAP